MQGTKTWILPLTVGEHTVRNLEKLGFSIDPRIYDMIHLEREKEKELADLETQSNTEIVISNLPFYPFQKVAVAWMVKAGGGINAMPVGVGKTLMAIGTVEILNCQKILVIAPKSLLYQWQNEIKLWQPTWNTMVIEGDKQKRKDLYWEYKIMTTPSILIVSYEIARIDKEQLCLL